MSILSRKDYENIRNKVYNFKTKYPQGFIDSEWKELIKDYPDMDMDKFKDALFCITVMGINDETIIYHCDIEKAIICGLEKRGLGTYEWD